MSGVSAAYQPPQERDRARWTRVAFCAAFIADLPEKDQAVIFLRNALEMFDDVPDEPPDRDDTPAFARFAVKMLLEVLTGETATQAAQAGEAARREFEDLLTAGPGR